LWWRLNNDQEVEYGGDVGILEGGYVKNTERVWATGQRLVTSVGQW